MIWVEAGIFVSYVACGWVAYRLGYNRCLDDRLREALYRDRVKRSARSWDSNPK